MTKNKDTTAQNSPQKKPRLQYTSRYKGISRNAKNGKFTAQIKIKGKPKYLGYSQNEDTAAKIYNIKVYKLMQEGTIALDLARLNSEFPYKLEDYPEHERKDLAFLSEVKSKKNSSATSSYRGVSFYNARKIWKATIQFDVDGSKKKFYLGRFKNEVDAARRYNTAVDFFAKEFNKPELLKRKNILPEELNDIVHDTIPPIAATANGQVVVNSSSSSSLATNIINNKPDFEILNQAFLEDVSFIEKCISGQTDPEFFINTDLALEDVEQKNNLFFSKEALSLDEFDKYKFPLVDNDDFSVTPHSSPRNSCSPSL